MGQFRKRLIIMTAAGILAVTTLAGCSGSLDNKTVIASVGKDEITLGVANFYARMQQAQYETYYAGMLGTTGSDMWSQEEDDGKTMEESTKETILESLENMYLLKQHAAEYKVELTEEEQKKINKAAAKFVEDNTLEDKEVVSGYEKNIKTILELSTIQSKMDAPMKHGVNEEVADEEAAQKAMQYVQFAFTKTDEAGASVDLTDEEKAEQKKKAQQLADTVKESKDLEAAAKEAGIEVQTGTFDSESTTPDTDLVKAADELKEEGDVTGLVETEGGLYVAKLTSKLDREATDAKKATIVNERKQEQYDALLKKWRKATEITEKTKLWKKISFEDQGVTVKTSEEDYTE